MHTDCLAGTADYYADIEFTPYPGGGQVISVRKELLQGLNMVSVPLKAMQYEYGFGIPDRPDNPGIKGGYVCLNQYYEPKEGRVVDFSHGSGRQRLEPIRMVYRLKADTNGYMLSPGRVKLAWTAVAGCKYRLEIVKRLEMPINEIPAATMTVNRLCFMVDGLTNAGFDGIPVTQVVPNGISAELVRGLDGDSFEALVLAYQGTRLSIFSNTRGMLPPVMLKGKR